MTYYKFLNSAGVSAFADCQWHLPVKNDDGTWTPGKWMPDIEGDLVLCENGYHGCELKDWREWADDAMYEIEFDGDVVVEGAYKVVGRRARLVCQVEGWNKRNCRLFAADCAEHVLHLFEDKFPNDNRPRRAIEAARACARGEIDRGKLQTAAWAAGAAWAAWAAEAAGVAEAARAAEAQWQLDRLQYYLEGSES